MIDEPGAEELARGVYGPRPDPRAVAVLAARRALTTAQEDAAASAADPATAVTTTGSIRHRSSAAAVALALAAVALFLATGPDRSPAPDPTPTDAAPVAESDTLVAFSRPSQSGTTPRTVTYQPNGYALVDPRGAGLRAELTCAGAGVVQVNLTDGTRFRFDCTAEQTVGTQVDPRPHRRPFVVIAATTGDIVWDLRISAIRSPAMAGGAQSSESSSSSARSAGSVVVPASSTVRWASGSARSFGSVVLIRGR